MTLLRLPSISWNPQVQGKAGSQGLLVLTLSSADNLCKQFGPRPGLTEKMSVLIWIQTI